MTIEERIAEAEALNAKLRGIRSHPIPPQPTIMRKDGKPYDPTLEPNLCSYDWLAKVKPSFRAFCERTLVGTTPTMAEILERKRKAQNSAIRSAMKPKGILTILKSGPYETGRLVKYERNNDSDAYVETLRIIRVSNDEWSSEEPDPEVIAVPQNVPAFGAYLPEPVADDDEEPENPPGNASGCPRTNAGTLKSLCAALELQNALLANLIRLRAV